MNRLHHRLFGYIDQSNRGQYEYDRQGLLSGRGFLHLRRGVLVLPLDVGESARMLVVEEGARAWLRRVELEPADEAQMVGAASSSRASRGSRGGVRRGSRNRR